MSLTPAEVRKVALLSRLELDDAEIERQGQNLNQLIEQFDILMKVDLTGVEPTSHSMPVYNVFREDVVLPSLTTAEALQNAPEARDGCFIVPRIVEG